MFTCVRGGILRQAESGVPVSELCREHGMSSASFYKWRSKYGGMDASMVSEMKAMADENCRLKRMYAERFAEGSPRKKAVKPSQRREMAMIAVKTRAVSIALACRTFEISETCYRYERLLSDENAEIADWLALVAYFLATVEQWCLVKLTAVSVNVRKICWHCYRYSNQMPS